MNTPMAVQVVSDTLSSAGGKPYLVGGCTRDYIMNIKPKDYDIEVFELSPAAVMEKLSSIGPTKETGKDFGVYRVDVLGHEIEVAIPRTEKKSGDGHTGFEVEVNPNMSMERAALRRDFTMNAIYISPGGEITDCLDGIRSIRNKLLTPSSEAFCEDALRVLRAMKFIGRFDGFVAKSELIVYSKILIDQYGDLSLERVWGEWKNLVLYGESIGNALEFLKDCWWVNNYPDLYNMIALKQSSDYHPEGDVWTHIKITADSAAKIAKRERLSNDDRITLVLAAIIHDLGKASHTELVDGKIISPGHAESREPLEFLKGIGCPPRFIKKIIPLVEHHMFRGLTPKAVRRLSAKLDGSTHTYALALDGGRPDGP